MHKLLQLLLIALICVTKINATDCPEAKDAPFKKVMNTAFAEDYQKCPTIVHAQFFSSERPKAWMFPAKVNNLVVFQCVAIGEDPKAMPLSGELTGQFITIPKDKSDLIFDLKRGDKVKITGVTWTEKLGAMGSSSQTVYFMATAIEKETQ